MVSRGALLCLAVICAAFSATAVVGDAVEASTGGDYYSDLKGGRQLLTATPWTPAWINQNGQVFAIQNNVGSGNTVQVGILSNQQANSAAVNNAQNNQNAGVGNGGSGNVNQSNNRAGRKLLTTTPWTPAWINQNGQVFAVQGNLASGNTVQLGFLSNQQANSAAVNNAQNNQNAGVGNGGSGNVNQGNNRAGRKLLTTTPWTPAWINQNGQVFAVQGNTLSGNTVQVGLLSNQQANSAAVNNAQNNQNAGIGNGGSGNVNQGNNLVGK